MRAVLLVGLLSLCGCESAASIGAACARSAECPAPLACRAGRCRTECRESRDCTIPLACVLLEPEVGACTLGEEASCSATAPCPAPLTCVDGACVQPCEDDSECAFGMSCEAGASCTRAAPPPLGCDPFSDAGCAEGERCVASGAAFTCVASASRGTGVVASPCQSDEDCAPSYVCPENLTPSDGSVGRADRRCVRVCRADTPSSCGPRSLCVEARSLLTGRALPVVPEGFGVCTEPCDLTTSAGCPDDEACSIATLDGARTEVYCRLTLPTALPFEPCAFPSLCPRGTLCEDRGGYRCVPFCDPVTAPCVAPGSRCERYTTLPGGRAAHLCTVPP